MIITFCGHRNVTGRDKVSEKVYEVLKGLDKNEQIDFYLGEYGDFDRIARKCCEKYKKEINSSVKLYFVTPYLDDMYLKNRYNEEDFDGIIYPEIENVPFKYAILKRNFWMADQADMIIACVNNTWGGASNMLRYALRRDKNCINLGNYGLI
ncbi:MAG: hypothetical protein HDT29_04800 [Clostridiales bacterium]|nr:hypothetical protein [Clostridiales bacterium]